MKLEELILNFKIEQRSDKLKETVESLSTDSRKIDSKSVFIAISGTKNDGHQYLNQVALKKPLAIILEDRSKLSEKFDGVIVKVQDTRSAIDVLASRFYNNPSEKLFCIGVTGTKGKTSITYMTEKMFSAVSKPCGVMGTVDHHLGSQKWLTELTTPGPIELQARLKDFVDHKAQAAIMEISSHALEQKRAHSVQLDVAVFTNLTRDHLDYHGSMENYFEAKNILFNEVLEKSLKKKKFAILNIDDPWSKKIVVSKNIKTITYGQSDSDYKFHLMDMDFNGSHFDLEVLGKKEKFFLATPGVHNVSNAVCAIAIAQTSGISLDVCKKELSHFHGVAGRLQKIENNKGLFAFVDYAHTDDALKNVLTCLNEVRTTKKLNSKIITVFGCGGDRDKGKRPMMAARAEELSDIIVVTSDNPRTEKPEAIIEDIVQGFKQNKKIFKITDRKEAITKALSLAKKDDVVLIAGKGHEDYQIIGDKKIHFSDVEVVEELLK